VSNTLITLMTDKLNCCSVVFISAQSCTLKTSMFILLVYIFYCSVTFSSILRKYILLFCALAHAGI